MNEQTFYKFAIDEKKEISLKIDEGVFTPTGTTKVLFKAVLEKINKPEKMLDLGCGCGVMGIALQQVGLVKELLYASDLSEAAVVCTLENASKYKCPIVAKTGSLFNPWLGEKFDYIVDDVSGISDEIAKISPWFANVPCNSGLDGSSLVVQVIEEASNYLTPGGRLFFPIISFSNVDKIKSIAQRNFKHVERVAHEEWPLPKEMMKHIPLLRNLQAKGCVQITEKFGLVLWYTDVYIAYNY
ncbi:hypothetical protein A3J90_07005 [candidate division WOR-1 bacterium RIFOXYC2_FULL_37_10]|uniref:Methyltransferase small domain-containing protein n=1 Tax=candidate division WOR-1 bacterium RIFOXYB2_FULL_37_13 TaxID=1802579 RepID=A0A1F4SQ83_UNCSA|nr:MAG: hypothetical protein A2310_07570 [candidate division WOR-1 bacterium RIFOXYB2_FULL_37_13]OGC34232.1 MAG: hypothetical protein A3J90_07005 [candidate division WOR-1 bacterium RIFOXYC2_FULL_37_10]